MTTHTVPLPAPSVLSRLTGRAWAAALRLVTLVRAHKNRRDLQMLAGFDERMLRDIGLTRGDLRDAINEPLWRDPTNVLVMRVRERRQAIRGFHGAVHELIKRSPAKLDRTITDAPPLAPEIDAWSSRQFPARSRYY
jgi:uncharacterized protein YjiS (DUF1127 family)